MLATRIQGAGFRGTKVRSLLNVCAVLSMGSLLIVSPGCDFLAIFFGGGAPQCTTNDDCTDEGLGNLLTMISTRGGLIGQRLTGCWRRPTARLRRC